MTTRESRLRARGGRQVAGVAVVAAGSAAVLGLGLAGRAATAVGVLGLLVGLGLLWTVWLLSGIRRQLAVLGRGQDEAARALKEAVRAQRRIVQAGQRALTGHVDGRHHEATRVIREATRQLVRRQRDQTQEIEALLQLFTGFNPRAPMPSSGHWALNPTDLLELWSVLARRRPATVLELGSGVSSVWLGYALERHGGRLVCVDHDSEYAAQTRAQLRRHGLDPVAEVRVVPLRTVEVDGVSYQWYDRAGFDGLSGVDMLLVDGPPGGTGPLARYPALAMLHDRLIPGATVLLDDADRADEQEILRRWEKEYGLCRQPGTLGHLAVLAAPGT